MSVIQNWAGKKALRIDARRWALAAPLLNSSEDYLFNTPCHLVFEDATHDGFLFLTSEALVAIGEHGSKGMRIPLDGIGLVRSEPGYRMGLWVGWRDGDGELNANLFDLFPSVLSKELWDELIARVRHRLVELDPSEFEGAPES